MRVPSFRLIRPVAAVAVAFGALAFNAGISSAGDLPTTIGGKHVMWGMGQGYPSASAQTNANQLISHGGLVETKPAVYIVYWGPEWQKGFKVSDGAHTYSSGQASTYINSFFNSLGGTSWAGVQ